jgi:DNA mismatch endonuclease (patch repair protein)
VDCAFRVDVPVPFLPRHRADVVFGPLKVAVFIDGCFWHDCPRHGTAPRSNGAWWQRRFEDVRARDRRTDEAFRVRGWHVIRVWEHEEVTAAADRIEAAVRARRSDTGSGSGRSQRQDSRR